MAAKISTDSPLNVKIQVPLFGRPNLHIQGAMAMKRFLLPGFALLLLTACSSEPAKTSAPVVKDPEFVAGRTAFQKMYAAARGWHADAQIFRITSALTKDSKGHDGKSAVWQAWFASATARSSKPYVWCGTNASDVERGISWGGEDSYSPTNTSTRAFDAAFLKADSDAAFQVALKHGGAKLLEKDADQPVMYLLEWDAQVNAPTWHVIFGDSRTTYKLSVLVNASSGEYLRAEK